MRVLIPKGSGRRGDDDGTLGKDYNTIEPTDTMDERRAKLEAWIAKQIGMELMRKYDQREWKVIVDIENQMLIVACDSISNHKGYHIKMLHRTIDELQKRAVMAAGEILERHNVARSRRFNPDVLETLARDAFDNVVTADSAAEPI
jgi:hypothetical protein